MVLMANRLKTVRRHQQNVPDRSNELVPIRNTVRVVDLHLEHPPLRCALLAAAVPASIAIALQGCPAFTAVKPEHPQGIPDDRAGRYVRLSLLTTPPSARHASCLSAFWLSFLPLQSPLSLPTIVRICHAVCRWTHAPVINGFDQWVVNLPRHKFASCSSLSAFNQTNDTINQRRV